MTARQRPRRGGLWLAGRAAGLVVLTAVLVAALPVTVAAVAAFWLGWRRGWEPWRLVRAAVWCLPMVAVWLIATGFSRHGLLPVARAPSDAWLAMWRDGTAGSVLAAMVVVSPAAVPLGLLAGALAWSQRRRAMATQAGGLSPGRY